ncbi:MAG: type II toxin-antitoxin system RelE/ParE family toxin [Bacteroides sp.]|nr:type II toxin-antitoxin system RelE/ParE family toxin [Bacteroides sp.]
MNGKSLTIVLSDEAKAFIKQQPISAQKKIYYNIFKVEGGVMDKELFKKLANSDIWELRTLFNGISYRLFAFWDDEIEAYVLVTHGIVKKTQKTPQKEIAKAETMMKEYFNNKNK